MWTDLCMSLAHTDIVLIPICMVLSFSFHVIFLIYLFRRCLQHYILSDIFCAATSRPMYPGIFSDFQNVWIRYWKRKQIPQFRTRFCRLKFIIWFLLKSWNPQIYQTVEMDEDEEGAYILCYKIEVGHQQLLLIVFGIRNYRLPICFLFIHPFW
jgi:hypothetical protein